MRALKKWLGGAILAGSVAGTIALTGPVAPAHADAVAPAQAEKATPVQANLESKATSDLEVGVPLTRASVFPCDWVTHICVKNNKSETKWIAAHTSALSGGGIAGAGALCSKIPLPFPTKAACVVVVSTAGGALADSYNGAAAKGRCVEPHFSVTLLGLTHWKTEGC